MINSKAAKYVTFVALISWFCASLFGLHTHIHLDGSPSTPDTYFFKDALDDAYGHLASPHVDAEHKDNTPTKHFNPGNLLLIASVFILLLNFRAVVGRSVYQSHLAPPHFSLRPPLRAPPRR